MRAGASSVKLEGGVERAERIAAIVNAGIPVIAHIGVGPQTAALDRGFRRRTDRERLLADADAVVAAGAFAVVLEMVDPAIAGEITARIPIPTIGIGSGAACDAQILVLYDLLGLSDFIPPFVKPYVNLAGVVTAALQHYAADVAAGRDPRDGPSATYGSSVVLASSGARGQRVLERLRRHVDVHAAHPGRRPRAGLDVDDRRGAAQFVGGRALGFAHRKRDRVRRLPRARSAVDLRRLPQRRHALGEHVERTAKRHVDVGGNVHDAAAHVARRITMAPRAGADSARASAA